MEGSLISHLRGLSVQLLILTLATVMVVEVLIYVPSLADFRKSFLDQRLVAGQTAALALEGAEGARVPREIESELLAAAGLDAVIVNREDARQLMLRSDMPQALTASYDLRDVSYFRLMRDALATLLRGGEGAIQVRGEPLSPRHRSIEIVMPEAALYEGMVVYSYRVLGTSLIISLATAGLVYFALLWLVVLPTCRIADNVAAFSKNPESQGATLRLSGRKNEIGVLEAQIVQMQTEIRQALAERARLAELGLAISQINHDLKNILATARLSADSLGAGASPSRQRRAMERLVGAIGRAVSLCEKTLAYGRADEVPEKTTFSLPRLIKEVRFTLAEEAGEKVSWEVSAPEGLTVCADRDHLFRALFNLVRNAIEAMEGTGTISITAEKAADGKITIQVADTGPGIPERVRDALFVPFAGTTKGSGSGLGLATARALARANGGDVLLETTGLGGTVFALTLPPAGKA